MARRLTSNQDIQDYLRKVQIAADHHGPSVDKVIQPLSKAVLARLDLKTDEIQVYERNGNTARTCWVTINGTRYVFTYDYVNKRIKLLEKSLQNKSPKALFDNTTSQAEIISVVSSMGPR